MEIYVVEPGDTVNSIAAFFGVPADQIIFDNQLVSPYELAIGQALFIGTGERQQELFFRGREMSRKEYTS